MRDDLIERREETWDLLQVKGFSTSEVARKLAQKYGVKEATIRKDISRMDNWLDKLDDHTSKTAASRMREFRQNRQRMHQMAMEARQNGDLDTELKIRRAIDSNVEIDVELSQSLGLTTREPDRAEVAVETRELDPESEAQFDDLIDRANDAVAGTEVTDTTSTSPTDETD